MVIDPSLTKLEDLELIRQTQLEPVLEYIFRHALVQDAIDTGGIIQQGGRWATGKDIENMEIPDNLQSILLARIDCLPEDTKCAPRAASVIGRQFSVNLLEQVINRLS